MSRQHWGLSTIGTETRVKDLGSQQFLFMRIPQMSEGSLWRQAFGPESLASIKGANADTISSENDYVPSFVGGTIYKMLAFSGRRCYQTGMSDSNVYDFDHRPQIELLEQQLGRAECVRLGFMFEDDEGIVRVTVAGYGYLLYTGCLDIQTVAEAFAAGYQCAREEMA